MATGTLFTSELNEMAIWNRVLTTSEVKALWNDDWREDPIRQELNDHIRLYVQYGIPVPQEVIDAYQGRKALSSLRA